MDDRFMTSLLIGFRRDSDDSSLSLVIPHLLPGSIFQPALALVDSWIPGTSPGMTNPSAFHGK
jgi:hypothetical protein